ncbi:MAG TPA: ABC transporter substrate-binding protein [Burkholderiales bacterium]|nr:ABC transporter substrate-binding protein [Burkholderiales bacterium]
MNELRALLLALVLAPAYASAQTATRPVVVGAAVAQTGQLADLAAGYREALLLWQDEVNAAGGLLGRRVELRLIDDRSEAITAERLYERLMGEHRADLLIGPFGSAASRGAAAAADRAHRVLINASGATQSVLRAGHRYVFQVAAPYAVYGTGVLAVVRQAGYRRLFILARDDPASREMATHAAAGAARQGMSPGAGGVHVYAPALSDFEPLVAMARAAGADAWIAFGEANDAAEMVKTFKRLSYAPRLLFAQGAADPRFIAAVGQDAEQVIGLSAYEPFFATPGNAEFVKAFEARWSSPPGLAAAEGYAAAKVLELAVRRAGSLDQERLRETLAALTTETVLGEYKLDSASGEQLGVRPALLQILKGRREVVWPDELATAMWQLPYPGWRQRQVLQK